MPPCSKPLLPSVSATRSSIFRSSSSVNDAAAAAHFNNDLEEGLRVEHHQSDIPGERINLITLDPAQQESTAATEATVTLNRNRATIDLEQQELKSDSHEYGDESDQPHDHLDVMSHDRILSSASQSFTNPFRAITAKPQQVKAICDYAMLRTNGEQHHM